MRAAIDIVRWIFWGPFRLVVSVLSPKGLNLLEGIFSAIAYRIMRARRRIITLELKRSYHGDWSDEKIENAVRASFRNYFAAKFRLFRLDRLSSENIADFIDVEGLDRLNAELARGRGVILLNPHFGPFMLIMPALGYRGFKLSQMALQGNSPSKAADTSALEGRAYDAKFSIIEKRMPIEFINLSQGAMALRKVIKVLNEGEIVLFPATGRGGKTWHGVELMGRRALLSPVPFKLAVKTGASLVPVFVLISEFKTRVKIEEPIRPADDGESAEQLLERYATVLDSYVERYPGHFINYVYEMRTQIGWDDHPFFEDYSDLKDGEVERFKR